MSYFFFSVPRFSLCMSRIILDFFLSLLLLVLLLLVKMVLVLEHKQIGVLDACLSFCGLFSSLPRLVVSNMIWAASTFFADCK